MDTCYESVHHSLISPRKADQKQSGTALSRALLLLHFSDRGGQGTQTHINQKVCKNDKYPLSGFVSDWGQFGAEETFPYCFVCQKKKRQI